MAVGCPSDLVGCWYSRREGVERVFVAWISATIRGDALLFAPDARWVDECGSDKDCVPEI